LNLETLFLYFNCFAIPTTIKHILYAGITYKYEKSFFEKPKSYKLTKKIECKTVFSVLERERK
jgi:hypothetical protein